MKISNMVKELFSRERHHQRPGSIRAQISVKLCSWGHTIKRTRAKGTNSYTEPLAQTNASTTGDCLLDVGIEPTSISDLSDVIQQYLPENDHSTPGSCSVAPPVLVLEPSQPFYLSISPNSEPPATSEISVPPVPSTAILPQLIHSAVSYASSNTSTHKAISSAGSNKSSSTNTDCSDGLPATDTHACQGEHIDSKKQGLTTITPDITGDSHSSLPRLDDLTDNLNSYTGSPFTTLHQDVREEVDVQAGSCVPGMAEEESEVVHNSSDEATIQATGSSENSDKNEELRDRHDWDTIRKIPDLLFKQLFLPKISEMNFETATIDDCTINARFNGGFNRIVFMMLTLSGLKHSFVIRVPAIGTVARWQEGYAHNMRCEMALLAHLCKTVNIPVPEVIAFSDTLDTVIGAPFCLMTQLKGKPAHHVWFPDPANRNHVTANAITAELETKRCNTLRSLATIMAELQTLTFDKIGTPDLVNPSLTNEPYSATRSYRWTAPSKMEAAAVGIEVEVKLAAIEPVEECRKDLRVVIREVYLNVGVFEAAVFERVLEVSRIVGK